MTRALPIRTAERQHRVQSSTADMSDPVTSLLDTIIAGGIVPANPLEIETRLADGALIRFATISKPRKRNGWLVAFFDQGIPVFAVAGDWAKGSGIRWSFRDQSQLSASQRREQAQRIDRAKALRAAEKARVHAEAADRAARIWQSADTAVQHPYLTRKGIRPHRARCHRDSLILDIRDFDLQLHSLQFIHQEGKKRLLAGGLKQGHFIPVAGPEVVTRILICEGWATGCTLAEEDPSAVVLAAIDAGNLRAVAAGARNQWPAAELVVCGDDDRATPGNPGRYYARQAAIAAGASLGFPDFPADAPESLSDFNDLANWRGA